MATNGDANILPYIESRGGSINTACPIDIAHALTRGGFHQDRAPEVTGFE